MTDNEKLAARYLIRKNGAFYRPNAQGYTNNAAEAGRYTLEDAIRYSHPNGPDGPRDGITYLHESELPEAPRTPQAEDELAKSLRATAEAAATYLKRALAAEAEVERLATPTPTDTAQVREAAAKVAEEWDEMSPHSSRAAAIRAMPLPTDTAQSDDPLGEGENFMQVRVSQDGRTIGIDHPTEAPWEDVLRAHISLRDRLNERIAEQQNCPFAPDTAQSEAESLPTTDKERVLREAKDLPFAVKMAGAEAITLEHMNAKANYDAACDCWDAMIAALSTPTGDEA